MGYSRPQTAERVRGGRPIRAAQYVRMSTDHQRYSTENQREAIQRYAAQHGMEVVRTYTDEGKSGLSLEGRDALKKLIADVQSGDADFNAVLVYDVSRWGRFQDADESAYYEYLCRRVGIQIFYCGEPFENDGTPMATIMKSIKRAMAGEYSRELSHRVFLGQCRLIELGFRQGGSPGPGLRRMLVDGHRKEKGLLSAGEYKSLQTDRVILVPGPPEEVAIVRNIYTQFLVLRRSEQEIARDLNARGLLTDRQRSWTKGTVHTVLTNEKYFGENVYNKNSFKLQQRHVRNGHDMWVRCKEAFQPIVPKQWFLEARKIILRRARCWSDDEMLARLRDVYEKTGWLSGPIIDEQEGMPSSRSYARRFGGLLRAYELIGFDTGHDYRYLGAKADCCAKCVEKVCGDDN
ncbi:recombinase family protein [Dyella marensis]|uniref:Site-specific DNA recombinase n=1 Tax=Dyella marensis TaxID=500610 RepID=A0A1I2AA02_9GAMM|nr:MULTISPECIES: recombinase family protein [Dyella]SFE40781.1 Site-specific DNA recombinase [Dyella marensis]